MFYRTKRKSVFKKRLETFIDIFTKRERERERKKEFESLKGMQTDKESEVPTYTVSQTCILHLNAALIKLQVGM